MNRDVCEHFNPVDLPCDKCKSANVQKSTLREAAQQALEALEGGADSWQRVGPAIDALRAALAEPVLQTCNCRWDGEMQMQQCTLHEAHVDAIKEWAQRAKFAEKKLAALAEPVQDPVAWRTFDGEGGYDYRTYEDNEDYAAEWAKRNPRHVGWVEPLYTAPPQRKPLTREEAIALWADKSDGPSNGEIVSFARAIERAHGIV